MIIDGSSLTVFMMVKESLVESFLCLYWLVIYIAVTVDKNIVFVISIIVGMI